MTNPFEKMDITLKLSFRDLVSLQKLIESVIPQGNEGVIIYLHEQVSKKIQEIENESN